MCLEYYLVNFVNVFSKIEGSEYIFILLAACVHIVSLFVCVLVCTCAFFLDFDDSKGSILLYLNHFKDIKKNYCCGVSSLKLDRTN